MFVKLYWINYIDEKKLKTILYLGWQLGSDPEIQVATVVSNHLTAGIMKYFSENFRYERAVNLFEKYILLK